MISNIVKYKDKFTELKKRNKKYSFKLFILWIFLILEVLLLSFLGGLIEEKYSGIFIIVGLIISWGVSFYVFLKKTNKIALNLKEKFFLNLYYAEVYLEEYLAKNLEDKNLKKSKKFLRKIINDLRAYQIGNIGFESGELISKFLETFERLINHYILKKISINTPKGELEEIKTILGNLFISIEEENLEQAIKISEFRIKKIKEKINIFKSFFIDKKNSPLLKLLSYFILVALVFLLIIFIIFLFNLSSPPWWISLALAVAIVATIHKFIINAIFSI